MSPFEVPEGPYSIDRIMRAIEEQVVRPAENEGGTVEPALQIQSDQRSAVHQPGASSSVLVSDGSALSNLQSQLELMWQRSPLPSNYTIHSHRRLIGWFFVSIKKVINWGSRGYVEHVRLRQEAFNEAAVHAVHETTHQLYQILDSIKYAKAELERLNGEEIRLANEIDRLRQETESRQRMASDRMNLQDERVEEQARSLEGVRAEFEKLRRQLDRVEGRLSEGRVGVDQVGQAVPRSSGLETELNEQIEALKRRLALWERRFDLSPFYEALPGETRAQALEQTRGSFEDIQRRQSRYVDSFRDAPGSVLDIGCGRGEFLDLLREAGIEAQGVDLDPAMVCAARERGLRVETRDAIESLRRSEPASLGGVFAAQVIEHLFPGELLEFLQLARSRLAPGGTMILETLNPASVGVLVKSYLRDIDHKQPIHPEYLKLLAEMIGFGDVELHYQMPFSEEERLPSPPESLGQQNEALGGHLQAMTDRLNGLLYGPQDYHLIARQPHPSGEAKPDS